MTEREETKTKYFASKYTVTYNPWQVESLEAFAYLKCPECPFDCKEDIFFQAHALENHPLSIAFFGQTTKIKEELPDSDIGKVIIEKSCGEVSLMEQDTVENFS